jgi:hypothetical protein
VACISSYFNRQTAQKLELLKVELQKDQIKFTTFYNKQFNVLNEAGKLIGASLLNLKELYKIINYPFDDQFDELEYDNNRMNFSGLEDHQDFSNRYKKRSRSIIDNLKINSDLLISLVNENPRFINQNLRQIAINIHMKLEEVLESDKNFFLYDLGSSPMIFSYQLQNIIRDNIQLVQKAQEEFSTIDLA